METKTPDRSRDALALAALLELTEALQQAHFAARSLEDALPPQRDGRPADRVHALRMAAGRLAGDIHREIERYRAKDLSD
jgi:hypothetical protein